MEYKNKAVFLRKSKGGDHLYAFDVDAAFVDAINGSIVMNISEVVAVIEGKSDFAKVGILKKLSKEEK